MSHRNYKLKLCQIRKHFNLKVVVQSKAWSTFQNNVWSQGFWKWKLESFMNVYTYILIPKDLYLSWRMSQIKVLFKTCSSYLREFWIKSFLLNFNFVLREFCLFLQNKRDTVDLGKEVTFIHWSKPILVNTQSQSHGVFLPSEMRIDCISESNGMLFNHLCPDLVSFSILLESKCKRVLQYTWMEQLQKNDTYTLFSFCRLLSRK